MVNAHLKLVVFGTSNKVKNHCSKCSDGTAACSMWEDFSLCVKQRFFFTSHLCSLQTPSRNSFGTFCCLADYE